MKCEETEPRPYKGFPSPSGASHFQIQIRNTVFIHGYRFPSPSGASHFQISAHLLHRLYPQTFPSPSGASHFQILLRLVSIDRRFPSPSGASHFQINSLSITTVSMLVSVPFRGISFPNDVLNTFCHDVKSFRPLPGHLISK